VEKDPPGNFPSLPDYLSDFGEFLQGNGNLFPGRFAGLVNAFEFRLDFFQNAGLEVLFSAVVTLFARNIVDDQKLVVLTINVLNRSGFETFISTEAAGFFHVYALS